jgi:hypothetical protein
MLGSGLFPDFCELTYTNRKCLLYEIKSLLYESRNLTLSNRKLTSPIAKAHLIGSLLCQSQKTYQKSQRLWVFKEQNGICDSKKLSLTFARLLIIHVAHTCSLCMNVFLQGVGE